MKWPEYLTFIRHDTSRYNLLRELKATDPEYDLFLQAYNADPTSRRTYALAVLMHEKYALKVSDANTPLADEEATKAVASSQQLSQELALPDIVFVSPFLRAQKTYEGLTAGWPELGLVLKKDEERIRELDHGLALLYNDWRIFFTFHPEQRLLYELLGPYCYRWPQGENVPDVRERIRSWLNTITRDFVGKQILVVSHHLTILALRANLERLDEHEFNRLDEEEKPINCGVTLYTGRPDQGSDGRLELTYYNRSFA